MEGLNDQLQYIELSLDTNDSQQKDVQYSKLNWGDFFFTRPISNIKGFKVISAEIPFSYYLVTISNSSFVLAQNDGGSANVFITPGNYTGNEMASELASSLTTASALLTVPKTYSVTYSTTTNKFTITNDDPGTQFSLTFGTSTDDGSTNPRFLLGFGPGTWTSNATPSLTSPYVALVSGTNYLYLNSNAFSTFPNLFISATAGGGLNGNAAGPQIAKIPVNANPGGIIFYEDPDPTKYFDLDVQAQLTNLDLYLTYGDLHDTPLDLNGLSFSVKIGLLIYRNTQSIKPKQYEYQKMIVH